VSKSILPHIYNSLRKVARPANDPSVNQAIKGGFVALDDVFMQQGRLTMDSDASFAEKLLRLTPSSNGSCALLGLFDPSTCTLPVVCTCDSRAVLGYQNAGGKREAVRLFADQNVKNPAEVERVRREHLVRACLSKDSYHVGLQPTRVFGDGRQKWALELFNGAGWRFNANYYGKRTRGRPTSTKRRRTTRRGRR
jgi:pyruvate dehydrogenase phosphatase